MADVEYTPMPMVDKRIEAVMNAARLVQAAAFPDCCYQIAEAMSGALEALGIPAYAQACDVYGWNNDFIRYKKNDHIKIEKHNQSLKKKKKNTRHPQRKSSKPRPIKQIDPYTLAIYHEQVVQGTGYDGHVICIADGLILDATAQQFHRPHKNLNSSHFNIIPLQAFDNPPDEFKQVWCETKFMVETSFEQGLVAITQESKTDGQNASCLRPDIEPDNWLDFTPTARTNIPVCQNWILDIAQKTLDGIGEFDINELHEKYG